MHTIPDSYAKQSPLIGCLIICISNAKRHNYGLSTIKAVMSFQVLCTVLTWNIGATDVTRPSVVCKHERWKLSQYFEVCRSCCMHLIVESTEKHAWCITDDVRAFGFTTLRWWTKGEALCRHVIAVLSVLGRSCYCWTYGLSGRKSCTKGRSATFCSLTAAGALWGVIVQPQEWSHQPDAGNIH